MADPALEKGKVRLYSSPTNLTYGTYIDINLPVYPYDVEIHMPICTTQAADGTYSFYDPLNEAGDTLGTYDYRILTASIWRLPEAQKAALNAFLYDCTKGRCENIMMRLGDIATGFFPFGIDLGDQGDFIVRVLEREQGGRLDDPYNFFEDNISFIRVSGGAANDGLEGGPQGGLQIGDFATGLMYPQDGIKPRSIYNFQTGLSVNGVPNSLDGPAASDSWETAFELTCNGNNIYNVINELVNLKRTADISIIAPAGYYLYGMDQDSGGTYVSKMLGSSHDSKEMILKVSHIGYQQWKIVLNFWMKSKQEEPS